MINIQFYCRACKQDSKGYAPVEVSVNNSGDRTILSTPRKERPEVFRKTMYPLQHSRLALDLEPAVFSPRHP